MPKQTSTRHTVPLTVRIPKTLKDRLESARTAHPFRPSYSTMIEQGAELLLLRMKEGSI